jgi:hypothetical protein
MTETKVMLGDMKRVDPRTIWAHEAHDFTPWLYENLDKLGEALGLELEAQERECDVGDFSADIIARDLGRNRLVVVENQLEATDHSHLGQILTYAAGKDAHVVVWISPEFRDEHRQALDWLNREGEEDAPEFFGVELQVIQIDQSKPAVNLRPVAFPNSWTKEINTAGGAVSEKRKSYQSFFQKLLDDLRDKKFSNAKKAQPQNWYSFAAGVTGYVYGASFANNGRLRVDLYLDRPDVAENKRAFHHLMEQKDAIEAEYGANLSWEPLEGRRACRVAIYREGSLANGAEALDGYRAWMIEQLLKMKKVFGPRIG